ncbi:CCC motif membrane protein [Riemerella anatipestifer]|nr:CCC motif membrane protein [Riemerella anatipestifer]MDY3325390.1 CCC motif membrane protein [Riemerella anatipestifer]MDY3344345.1 CCC motif membrane protein [Riemerella anatipestifer]MDY3352620.1 CCC motif membrane protein [Riemerella anatipestifer]MDY3357425.1 CCC motif membrane protein [Riemerella anatipestifer]
MMKQNLPNATLVLVLGILSILGCCCYGVPGIILGVVALVMYKKDNQLYLANPELYANYSNLSTGRILAIIGIVLSALNVLAYVVLIVMFGFEALTDQELLQERIQEMIQN